MRISREAAAQEAYGAYGASVGWRNFRGERMPSWLELPDAIREAWRAAAGRVLHLAEQELLERGRAP